MIIIKSIKSLMIICISFSLFGCSYKETPKYKVNETSEEETTISFLQKFTNRATQNSPKNIDEEQSSPSGKREGRRTVTVKDTIDGDTIRYFDPSLNSIVTARLIGINGPEYTKEKQLYGKEAKSYLTQLVQGKTIQIESDPNADVTDRYGRYLIHAFINGKNVQSLLLSEGLVRVAYLYADYKYIEDMKAAEATARTSGLNIWGIKGYVNDSNGFDMDVVNEESSKNDNFSKWRSKLTDIIYK
ncbi:thermonuclease family protein [Mesobacillus zeae]|uniref:thermonuclease family protein n=1 Tax=Mesobacillus zeae TaxID=1917180 RepID=UPI00300987E9